MKSRALGLAVPVVLLSALLTAQGGARQKLYVLSSNADDLTVIDVATNEIVKTITVGKLPHGIAAPKSQKLLYVATEGDDGLTVVDPIRDTVVKQYKMFGKRPNEIDITSDGRFVYVPAHAAGVYEVFDTVKETIVARIPTDGLPHNAVISPDDKYMYLSPMDRGTSTPKEMAERGLPSSENDKIYVVDAATHKTVATIPLGNTPRPIAIAPDGKRLYVNVDDFLGFVVVDLPARRVIARVPYQLAPEEQAVRSRAHGIGVTPDGREVWSTDVNNGLVLAFDLTANPPKQIAKLQTGHTPLWLTITPDGKTVYVANAADDTLSAYDVATKKEKARIQLPKGKAPKRMLVVAVPVQTSE